MTRKIEIFTAFCMVLILPLLVNTQVCKKINSCKCKMVDSGKIINLRSLAHPGNLPKWTLSGGDGWMYKYNPCIGYALGTYADLAVGQAATAGTVYDLGVQSSSKFNVTDEGKITIMYQAKNKLRSTTVILKCAPDLMYDRLDFLGEVRMTEYEMVLTSPCACPGYCDDMGLYEEVKRNVSGYWNNRYRDTNPLKLPVSQTSEIATSTVILVLHDVALVVIFISCVLLTRYCKLWRSIRQDERKEANRDRRYRDPTAYEVTSEMVQCHTCTCKAPSQQRFLTRTG